MTVQINQRTMLTVKAEQWPLHTPFRITGKTWTHIDGVHVTVRRGGVAGQGEGFGVYYHGETPETMIAQIEQARSRIESGISRDELIAVMPAGGARNAVDAALWDLESRESGRSVAAIAGLPPLRPLRTVYTIGSGSIEEMAAAARTLGGCPAIKVKLTGAADDGLRIRAIRAELPDAWIGIDANQGFTKDQLGSLMPEFLSARIALIEQPFPVEADAWLEGWDHPIPIAGDESLIDLPDVEAMRGRFECINIKLDKCGGLTRGLQIAARARELGFSVMVGNMSGTSLSMAPAFVLGQVCDVVDLDGPLLLAGDRTPSFHYDQGTIHPLSGLWGHDGADATKPG